MVWCVHASHSLCCLLWLPTFIFSHLAPTTPHPNRPCPFHHSECCCDGSLLTPFYALCMSCNHADIGLVLRVNCSANYFWALNLCEVAVQLLATCWSWCYSITAVFPSSCQPVQYGDHKYLCQKQALIPYLWICFLLVNEISLLLLENRQPCIAPSKFQTESTDTPLP